MRSRRTPLQLFCHIHGPSIIMGVVTAAAFVAIIFPGTLPNLIVRHLLTSFLGG